MAAVLFVELPSANTEAAAGNRGGFFIARFYGTLGPNAKDAHDLRARSSSLRRVHMTLPFARESIGSAPDRAGQPAPPRGLVRSGKNPHPGGLPLAPPFRLG